MLIVELLHLALAPAIITVHVVAACVTIKPVIYIRTGV